MSNSLANYWHTLRYLKPVQIYARLWRQVYRPGADLSPAPPRRMPTGTWRMPARRKPSMTAPDAFLFLNKPGRLDNAADWNDPHCEKLWLYNLHYFDDLNAENAIKRTAWHQVLIQRWIDENPPVHGVGWEPYPLSLRIVNWIKWALYGHEMAPAWLRSLAVQARYLSKRLEWHLLGNHLLANAKALVFAGTFFQGEEAARWREKGLRILADQLAEQVLADGGHFERSPMYHSIILEDVLDLINLAQAFPDVLPEQQVSSWINIVQAMRRWLLAMIHPDGEISFFNDAAFGIAPAPAELEAYAQRLQLPSVLPPGTGITHLRESGYIRVALGEMVALLDVAPIGPDYLPGHAHADTLSFELSLGKQRVIVNSGTSEYGTGPERQLQRGTAAHNTVEVDGCDSSEVWGGFRVAQRARPFDLRLEESADGQITIACAHDGYRRLPGRVVHRRRWIFDSGRLRIEDTLKGEYRQARAHLHLHPDVQPEMNGTEGLMRMPGDNGLNCQVRGASVQVMGTCWHPEFGLTVPSQCLRMHFRKSRTVLSLSW